MLSREEKAYCRGLEALRRNDYISADQEFTICGELYGSSRGFKIISEATRLLAMLQREKTRTKITDSTIQEAVQDGEKAIICGQGIEEETR
jgi:hypothetical protein